MGKQMSYDMDSSSTENEIDEEDVITHTITRTTRTDPPSSASIMDKLSYDSEIDPFAEVSNLIKLNGASDNEYKCVNCGQIHLKNVGDDLDDTSSETSSSESISVDVGSSNGNNKPCQCPACAMGIGLNGLNKMPS